MYHYYLTNFKILYLKFYFIKFCLFHSFDIRMSLLYGVKNKPEAQISVSKFMLRTSDDCEKKNHRNNNLHRYYLGQVLKSLVFENLIVWLLQKNIFARADNLNDHFFAILYSELSLLWKKNAHLHKSGLCWAWFYAMFLVHVHIIA